MPLHPEWLDQPVEQWPPAAREFYRLLLLGWRRAAEQEAKDLAAAAPGGPDQAESAPQMQR